MLSALVGLFEKLLAALAGLFAYRSGQHSVKLLEYKKHDEHQQTRARLSADVAGLSGPVVIDQLRRDWSRHD